MIPFLADSCNPAVKGCVPHNYHGVILGFAIFIGVLLAIALLIVMIAVRRNRKPRR